MWVAMAGSHQLWRLDPAAGTIEPVVGSGRRKRAGRAVAGSRVGSAVGVGPGRFPTSLCRFREQLDPVRRPRGRHGGTARRHRPQPVRFRSGRRNGRRGSVSTPTRHHGERRDRMVADTYNSRIRTIDLDSGRVATLAGSDPGWRDGETALFSEPGGIDLSDDGRLFVADTNNHSIRVVDSVTGATSTWVITGVEAVEPAVDSADFSGVVRQLEPQRLSKGPASLVLDVRLPAGYKVNPLAPSTFTWSGDGVAIPEGARGTVLEPEFPMIVDLEVLGSGSIVGDISLVYCEADVESICLVERLRIIVPVVAVESGSSEVRVDHQVALPVDL